ncbi:MAG: 16S rRNA (guanine(527)-N(7))-methyltransferase RsmG [Micrococcales bacterium]|nr:16S rRNA (guanine(527)-N(7))-methyltransferase RsmG [Micrococcales bacterium]
MGQDEARAGGDPLDGDPRLPQHFGDAWPTVLRFRDLLQAHGEERGLLGPQESTRLWERHLLNSAALVPFVGQPASIIDLGSGAGLPGVVVAAMCPKASVTLLEPMDRRVTWLNEVVADLGLANAHVVRGRAEDVIGQLFADVVVTRAVGPLKKLYGWAAPLLGDRGRLVALKGARAADEVLEGQKQARKAGLTTVEVHHAPTIEGVAPTTVVVARRAEDGD